MIESYGTQTVKIAVDWFPKFEVYEGRERGEGRGRWLVAKYVLTGDNVPLKYIYFEVCSVHLVHFGIKHVILIFPIQNAYSRKGAKNSTISQEGGGGGGVLIN